MAEYRHIDVEVAAVVPAANNSRTHDKKQIRQVVASIEQWGFTNPILVDEDYNLLAGHARIAAAQVLELEKIPAVVLSGLSEDQKRAYLIADNKLAMNAGWNDEMLLAEMKALEADNFPLSDIGFSEDEVREILTSREDEGLTDVDAVPDVSDSVVVSELGAVWDMGGSVLICGDARDAAVYDHIPSVDCVWTDPPYGVEQDGVVNDDLDLSDFMKLLGDAFALIYERVEAGTPAYVCCAGRNLHLTAMQFENAGFRYSTQLVWLKNNIVKGWGDYHWKHENIIYGWKPKEKGGGHNWRGGRRQNTLRMESDYSPIAKTGKDEYQIAVGNAVYVITGGEVEIQGVASTIFYADKPMAAEGHPTIKPVEIIREMLINSAEKGDVILDPFAGSGSTGIAAIRCGMKFALVELSPAYCDLAISRWQEYTGKDAVNMASGETYNAIRTRLIGQGGGMGGA